MSLQHYVCGFAKASEPWPALPRPADPELSWWHGLLDPASGGPRQGLELLTALKAAMPQLLLPQQEGISSSELYKALVLRGEDPGSKDLQATRQAMGGEPQWQQPEALQLWIAPHPIGAMPVLHTPNGADFATLVRALAHRAEPVELADGVHAQAISGLIHWGLIRAFGRQSRARMIVLHRAPYGSVAADQAPGGLSETAWLEASNTLRLEHELTHLATKQLLGEMRLNLLDELVADAMGMVAALGCFEARLFGRCLGLDEHDQPIANGRWLSYTRELSETEAREALDLVMARARELETALKRHPHLLQPQLAMVRLQWLCQQRLDVPLTAAPASHG